MIGDEERLTQAVNRMAAEVRRVEVLLSAGRAGPLAHMTVAERIEALQAARELLAVLTLPEDTR